MTNAMDVGTLGYEKEDERRISYAVPRVPRAAGA